MSERLWAELPEEAARAIQRKLGGDPFADVDRTKYTVVRYGKPRSFVYVDEGELRAIMAQFEA